MSAITRILHDALIRERYIDDLFSQLPRTPDPADRRSLLAKIEALRAERDPAMCAWLQAAIDQEVTTHD
jgi:hypothetical protein